MSHSEPAPAPSPVPALESTMTSEQLAWHYLGLIQKGDKSPEQLRYKYALRDLPNDPGFWDNADADLKAEMTAALVWIEKEVGS